MLLVLMLVLVLVSMLVLMLMVLTPLYHSVFGKQFSSSSIIEFERYSQNKLCRGYQVSLLSLHGEQV